MANFRMPKFKFWCVDIALDYRYMMQPMTLREVADYASTSENEDWGNRIFYYCLNDNSYSIPLEFTGIYAGGIELYEGDIVDCDDTKIGGYKGRGKVVYNTDRTIGTPGFYLHNDIGLLPIPFMCTIIGNIYENPELMGK